MRRSRGSGYLHNPPGVVDLKLIDSKQVVAENSGKPILLKVWYFFGVPFHQTPLGYVDKNTTVVRNMKEFDEAMEKTVTEKVSINLIHKRMSKKEIYDQLKIDHKKNPELYMEPDEWLKQETLMEAEERA
ncbi:MAG: hypothetical protein KAJ24_00610 [Candidatus Aenigmarchaeota archaeon]|nr:hypothetical protein [Candidatus Aenigmarchaeota archaeon]